MFKSGHKYIIGGRHFWCVGFNGEGGAILVSGGTQLTIPSNSKETYTSVGVITPGESYTARQTFGSIKAGEAYIVTSYDRGKVVMGNSEALPLEVFAALFH